MRAVLFKEIKVNLSAMSARGFIYEMSRGVNKECLLVGVRPHAAINLYLSLTRARPTDYVIEIVWITLFFVTLVRYKFVCCIKSKSFKQNVTDGLYQLFKLTDILYVYE